MSRCKVFYDPDPIMHYPSGMSIYAINLLRTLNGLGLFDFHGAYATLRGSLHGRLKQLVQEHELPLTPHAIYFPGRAADFLPTLACRCALPPMPAFDLIHATSYLPPAWLRGPQTPTVLTIHDLVFLRFSDHPEYAPSGYAKRLRKHLQNAIRHADCILSVSEFTKRELIDLMHIPEEKIIVSGQGTQWRTPPLYPDESMALLDELRLEPMRYILCVSSINPRKNFDMLLTAFSKCRQQCSGIELVIVGKPGFAAGRIPDRIRGEAGVKWLSSASEAELRALYTHAAGFALLSWYEGFGIPCLEAMECGCPVIYARGSAMDEVVGDAGLPVSPADLTAVVHAMVELFRSSSLRNTLSQRSVRQSRRYSWSQCARKTIEAYERALSLR